MEGRRWSLMEGELFSDGRTLTHRFWGKDITEKVAYWMEGGEGLCVIPYNKKIWRDAFFIESLDHFIEIGPPIEEVTS